MTTPSFEAALTFVEQVPYGARPILLLVDVDPQEPHHYQHHYPNGSLQTHDHYLKATNGAVPDRLTQANGRHARTASDNAKPSSRARRPQAKSKPIHDANLSGLQFLETVLQGLAKGCIGHVVPVAVCSSQSQDKILELFNMGVADVLIKPIEEQVARTLFLVKNLAQKNSTWIQLLSNWF
ncbi:MAG: hypothetical protein BYD32DRAFT_441979 [Podila humilis]|nr:MAG: hypothetical protein BYD32DRAFT_441979 [Podila humilis]